MNMHPPAESGVPLGGVGAGCIEMGGDGRFRGITINNNRTTETRIPVSRHGFVAIRAEHEGRVWSRMLQAGSDVRFEGAGIRPSYAGPDQMAWRGLYPRSDYRLNDSKAPITVCWTALTPIIPFDLDASMLPVVFFSFQVQNRTASSVEVTTVISWENICGCTGADWREDRGSIRMIMADLPERPDDEEAPEQLAPGPVGLELGMHRPPETNAEGHYCLLTRDLSDVEVSVKSWDAEALDELEEFWGQFHDDGFLDNRLSPKHEAHIASVACTVRLRPNEPRQIVYAFAWHCPRFVVNGVDQGNRYATVYHDAKAVARHALHYWGYLSKAVENWHKRFLTSSLPPWLVNMLINNNHVLSTNTLLGKEGGFAMFETPGAPWTGALDRRFHSSIGTLLFFPGLEFSELEHLAEAEVAETPGRLHRYLGKECFHEPTFGEFKGELLDLNAKFILMAYRDFLMTGRIADIRKHFERIERMISYVLAKDRDGDGLPEAEGFSTSYDCWVFNGIDSYSGSLWIAALRVFSELCHRFGDAEEARRCEAVLATAQASFERRLWNEEKGYYYLHDNAAATPGQREPIHHGCVSGQLAGQWIADFLGLGCLFPPRNVERALVAISESHKQGHTTSWPAFHATHYVCLELCHGDADRALESVRSTYESIHIRKGRAFNQPLCWDLRADGPTGWGRDRHMSPPSSWHVLYALQGFLLNVPDRLLWLRPHLPRGVYSLSAPLFTPLCFGWLRFGETLDDGRYRQAVRISFDSPVQVETLVLRVPEQVQEVRVRTAGPEGCTRHKHNFGYDGRERLVEIQFGKPITITEPLQVELVQTEGSAPSLPPVPSHPAR